MNKHTHTKKMSYYTQPLYTLTIEIIVDELKASAIDGNHRINTFFTMEMVIYRYIEIIGELLLPPNFLYNIYDDQKYYPGEPVYIHIQ